MLLVSRYAFSTGCAIVGGVRLLHLGVGSVVFLGGAGVTLAAFWAISLPTYLCDEGISVPGGDWVYAGLLLFALALPILVFVGTLIIDAYPTLQRIWIGIALAEAAAAVVLTIYLSVKYSHYQCG